MNDQELRNNRKTVRNSDIRQNILTDIPSLLPISNVPSSLITLFKEIKAPELISSNVILSKYKEEHMHYNFIKICLKYYNKKIDHTTFCEQILIVFRDEIKKEVKFEESTRNFFNDKINVFQSIVAEFGKIDESVISMFDILISLVNKLEINVDYNSARKWLVEKINDIVLDMFINSSSLLSENVLLKGI